MPDKTLWDSCLHFFESSLPPQQFNSWIKPLVFEIKDDQITLTAPNSFVLKLVQERFLPEISKRAIPFFSAPPAFQLRIGKKSAVIHADKPAAVNKEMPIVSLPPLSTALNGQNKLNPLLSFANFVTGKANQLAHSAAIQVAEAPGTSYNPL
ncbi:MAG: DnaA N-terminal domain-containing protein, partial [Gallionellaceae bacterium]|nr:DnaA N-terminal domain-containing protein [Gallionellaceae bacterium]